MSAVFALKRLGATTVIGDSGASRHTFGDGTHVRNKRLPAAEEAYLIIGNGKRLSVACYGDLDLVLHCERYGKPWSNLSDHYEIEKRSRLNSPFLRRQDVEHIVCASWATRKTRQLKQQSASGATPNPHALVASGGFQTSRGGYGGPRRGGGRSSESGRGIQQSWSRGGGNHHVNRHQQQQHPRSLSKPLTANFGLGGPFDGGTNAGGWPQEESPPSPNGSVPHCERCGRKGHMARICRAPLRFEGTCGSWPHCLCPAAPNFGVALPSPRHVCGFRVETSWRYNRDR